jgi:MoxR-vWA-beta-propeller ternary system domain bpX2
MSTPLDEVSCASLPAAALPALAPLRCVAGVTVTLAGDRAWLRWTPGDGQVLACVLPLAGAELFVSRQGLWYRVGQHLPAPDVPAEGDARPLEQVLVPAPVSPEPASDWTPQASPVRLVRDDRPRPATGMWCELAELVRWAERAASAELAAARAARSGSRVLLLGKPPPALPGGTRLWGDRLLVPLGFRPEPALPEGVLRDALGVRPDEIMVLEEGGGEVVPTEALQPLNRAGVRLAAGEGG